MSDDKTRREFEKLAKKKDMPLAKIVNNYGDTVYKNWAVQYCYEMYQARDAEVAELVGCLEWILPLAHQAIRNGIKHPQQSQCIRDAEEALAKHKQEGL